MSDQDAGWLDDECACCSAALAGLSHRTPQAFESLSSPSRGLRAHLRQHLHQLLALPLDHPERMFHLVPDAGLLAFLAFWHSCLRAPVFARPPGIFAKLQGRPAMCHCRSHLTRLRVPRQHESAHPESASTPMYAFMPKCHWLPFFV